MKRTNIKVVLLVEVLVVILGIFLSFYPWKNGWNIGNLFDSVSLILILLFAVPATLVCGMWKDFIRAFSVGQRKYTVSQLRRSLEAVSMMQKFILIGGLFNAIISFINMLYQLNDPAFIGPCVAVICLSCLYIAIFEFLLIPLRSNIQLTIISDMEMENEEE